MKLRILASHKWQGRTRFQLRAGDDPRRGALKGVTVPQAVGKTVTVARDAPSGKSEVVVSLGERAGISCEVIRRAGGAVAAWLGDNGVARAGVEAPVTDSVTERESVHALCEGLLLRDYCFSKHKSKAERRPQLAVDILVKREGTRLSALVRRARVVCAGTIQARDLAHEPPNVLNPVTLARRVRSLAGRWGLKCTVLDHRQLARMKMNALVAVGRASATPSRLIVLEYRGKGPSARKPVVLAGKAITFDTGGYSIKLRDSMLGMKYDKCGAMAVIGVMQAVAACKPKVPVIGVIAAAENMIAGDAYRPDDIITTMSGKTVEIVSADAEGRLVLCDALTFAQRKYKPRVLIDLATLTGGVLVALGKEAAGIFCNDDRLREALIASGERVHERLWPLPLWDDYFELIKGTDSDLKNAGGRDAHAIAGGLFLKQFVDQKLPWAHLDIAGVADCSKDLPYCPKGATGFGVRLLMDYLLGL